MLFFSLVRKRKNIFLFAHFFLFKRYLSCEAFRHARIYIFYYNTLNRRWMGKNWIFYFSFRVCVLVSRVRAYALLSLDSHSPNDSLHYKISFIMSLYFRMCCLSINIFNDPFFRRFLLLWFNFSFYLSVYIYFLFVRWLRLTLGGL